VQTPMATGSKWYRTRHSRTAICKGADIGSRVFVTHPTSTRSASNGGTPYLMQQSVSCATFRVYKQPQGVVVARHTSIRINTSLNNSFTTWAFPSNFLLSSQYLSTNKPSSSTRAARADSASLSLPPDIKWRTFSWGSALRGRGNPKSERVSVETSLAPPGEQPTLRLTTAVR
jgi:hypothetical protein